MSYPVVAYTLISDLVSSESLEICKYFILRGVALVSLMAFHSVNIQLLGLIGKNGLIPITSTLLKLKEFSDRSASMSKEPIKYCMKHLLKLVFQKFYTAKDSNVHLRRVCHIDMMVSAVAFVYPHPVLFVYLYFSYYSYKRVMDRFLNYQWDALILETLLLSTVLSLSFDSVTTTLCVWQFKILLFRLMFGSGVVKYFGRDESWHTSFTAMTYHFLTQPLPSALGMYIQTHSPTWLLRGMTVGTLVVELALPLLTLFNKSIINWLVAINYIILQVSIGISGYYGFFGTLTSVLSLSLFNDWFLVKAASLLSLSLVSVETIVSILLPPVRPLTLLSLISTALSAVLIYPLLVILTVVQLTAIHSLLQYIPVFKSIKKDSKPSDDGDDNDETEEKIEEPQSAMSTKAIAEALEKLHRFTMMTFFLGCHYGLFASMTKTRNEFTLSLSADKVVWHEVDFAFKPGSDNLQPKSVTKAAGWWSYYHMPRLDWSMWFLPFSASKASYPRWLWVMLISILEGNKDVLELFLLKKNWTASAPAEVTAKDSEPQRILYDGQAMQYMRVQLLNYTYADPKETMAASKEDKKYWNVKFVRDVVNPSSVEDLYELLDAYDKIIYGGDQSAKPKAESAQEIIARMLRLAQKQKKEKSEKQN